MNFLSPDKTNSIQNSPRSLCWVFWTVPRSRIWLSGLARPWAFWKPASASASHRCPCRRTAKHPDHHPGRDRPSHASSSKRLSLLFRKQTKNRYPDGPRSSEVTLHDSAQVRSVFLDSSLVSHWTKGFSRRSRRERLAPPHSTVSLQRLNSRERGYGIVSWWPRLRWRLESPF